MLVTEEKIGKKQYLLWGEYYLSQPEDLRVLTVERHCQVCIGNPGKYEGNKEGHGVCACELPTGAVFCTKCKDGKGYTNEKIISRDYWLKIPEVIAYKMNCGTCSGSGHSGVVPEYKCPNGGNKPKGKHRCTNKNKGRKQPLTLGDGVERGTPCKETPRGKEEPAPGLRCVLCKGRVNRTNPPGRRRLAGAATAAKLAEYEERFSG